MIDTRERRMQTMDEVKRHPFFVGVQWDGLRDTRAPFIPALDSEVDVGYFDDFTNEADMAKYAEVREKQRNVDRVLEKEEKFNRGVWVGFTFKAKKDVDMAAALASRASGNNNDDDEDDGELVTLF